MRALHSVSIIALLTLGGMTAAAPAAAQAYEQVDARTRVPPPPLPSYDQPPAPGYGYIWTPGYWAWDDYQGQYYWVEGEWVLPPEAGYLWTPGYWDYDGDDYVFYEGYWGPTVGYYGGIDYGFGYDGYGYDGGYWRGNNFYYNRYYNNFGHRRFDNVFESRDHYNRPQGWEHRFYGDRGHNDGGDHGRQSFIGQPNGRNWNGQPNGRSWNGQNGSAPRNGGWNNTPNPNGTNPPRPNGYNPQNPNWNGQRNPGWNNPQGHVNTLPPSGGAYVQPGGRPFNGAPVTPSQPPRQYYGTPPSGGQAHPMGGFQQGQAPRPTFTAPVIAPQVHATPTVQTPHTAQPAPTQNRGGQWRDHQ